MAQRLAGILVLLRRGHGAEVSRHTCITKEPAWHRG